MAALMFGITVAPYRLTICQAREQGADHGLGDEGVLGDDDAVHHVGSEQPAVVGDLVTPVTDLDSLGIRPKKATSCGGMNHSRKSGEHFDHQRDTAGTDERGRDGAAHSLGIEIRHQLSIGRTNDGVIVSPLPVRRTAVPAV